VVTSSVAPSSMSIDVGELPTRRRGDVLSLLTDRRRGRLGEDGAAASGDHLLRALGHPCEDVEHEVRTACLVSLCAVSAGSMVNLTGLRTAICCPSGRCMCCSLARYGRPAGWASPEGSVRGESSGTCAGSKVPPGTRVLGRARPGRHAQRHPNRYSGITFTLRYKVKRHPGHCLNDLLMWES
jgi:hypothetical protein